MKSILSLMVRQGVEIMKLRIEGKDYKVQDGDILHTLDSTRDQIFFIEKNTRTLKINK